MKTKIVNGCHIHNLGDDELCNFDLECIAELCQEAWYWYVSDDYDGQGDILLKKEDQWEANNLGHCSCYGPTDDLTEPRGDLEHEIADWNEDKQGLLRAALKEGGYLC